MQYTWDAKKAATNLKRHRVSFQEAAAALENDSNAVHDADLDAPEPRIRSLAWSARGRVLFVVTTERENDTIRIISARKANAAEEAEYHAENY